MKISDPRLGPAFESLPGSHPARGARRGQGPSGRHTNNVLAGSDLVVDSSGNQIVWGG